MEIKKTKQHLLDKLYEPYKKCLACPLATMGRSRVVFGSGNPDARLMIIGEAPGKEEDLQGLPFMGKSGQLLDRLLKTAGIIRDEIYITNVVKCRPPKNRPPRPVEAQTCKNILLFNQIDIIQPTIICTLGATALEALFSKKIKLSLHHGQELLFKDYVTIPTYHPAYVLRSPKISTLLLEDLTKIARRLP